MVRPALPIGDSYLQLLSWTVLTTIPTVGQGEAVSRYSVGLADRSGLSLRLSPSDTNIIPYFEPKVKGFWAEILYKVLAIFGAEIVQLDEEGIKRRAAALRATTKRKEGLRPHTKSANWSSTQAIIRGLKVCTSTSTHE